MTLAIETSCDDTSVAVVEKGSRTGRAIAQLHFYEKVTSNNTEYQGVHPLVSLLSHQENLAALISEAVRYLPRKDGDASPKSGTSDPDMVDITTRRLPDFISVTRGPGMRSNLFTGLDTAKGLSVAWQIPLVGVHHMQAHALTPRMVSALVADDNYGTSEDQTPPVHVCTRNSTSLCTPDFPFLSVLASGGHTLLIHSASLSDHRVLASTNDIAIGECLDKTARVVLPSEILQTTKSTMYGALLEAFALDPSLEGRTSRDASSSAFMPNSSVHSAETYLNVYGHQYDWYQVPINQEDAIRRNTTKWGWALNLPFTTSSGGIKISSLEMSFSGTTTMVERIVRYGIDQTTGKLNKVERLAADVSMEERKDLARETMRVAFEHVASRVVLGLQSLHHVPTAKPAIVVAGGVAANSLLRYMQVCLYQVNCVR
ncbi:glycoprotease pgp1 mitochondrial precursor [Decorospora gaudefroyi]|uniref:Glycoprotease pgp1 mitochondrial n=1 Tax=Decorospora gaudefroyi TaxID=184978 RepID=A0A6A5KTU3_9PLEO|nr:glycoprotease pgp1 mitochondrial precursor [Decorospora gaudefroyi]